jgi:hypothetical protein
MIKKCVGKNLEEGSGQIQTTNPTFSRDRKSTIAGNPAEICIGYLRNTCLKALPQHKYAR